MNTEISTWINKIEWHDKDALMMEVPEGPYKGIWRHARYGGWRRYVGSSWTAGDYAPDSLQDILDAFSSS